MLLMIEFIVSHNGEHWIAEKGELRAEARTLAHLDQEVERLLKEEGALRNGGMLEILMAFDSAGCTSTNSTISTGFSA